MNMDRWSNYVLEQHQGVGVFWAEYLKKQHDILFVIGRGFDPRMCLGIQDIMRAGGDGRRDVFAIEMDEGTESASHDHKLLVELNWQQLISAIGTRGQVTRQSLKVWSDSGRRISTRSAWRLFRSIESLNGYTDIVVDISALPRGVYIPLLARLMHMIDGCDDGDRRMNLHVLVAENPALDESIRDEGIEDIATYLYPAAGIERYATLGQPKIWIPVLGEGQAVQLRKIHDLVGPDEIAPVLPSPSTRPRRADNLLLEYREILFDSLRVEPSNFIFASERNPFEAYRQIGKAILHYQNALAPLGGCKAVISALSSKLMSVGSLLAAYELQQPNAMVGLAHVECQGYSMAAETPKESVDDGTVLFELWLCGECYED